MTPDESRLDYRGNIRGLTVYQVHDSHGFPKVRIREIENPTERDICLLYWAEGLNQREIVERCGVNKQYVSSVIKRYKRR